MSGWIADFCSCSGPCFSACCCPCIVIGKTQARLSNPQDHDPSCCNGTCMGYCGLQILGGWGFILAMIQRKQVRDSYKIDGSGCGDCCLSFWCPCCGILQQRNEIEEREKLVNKNGYQPQPGMHM